VPDGARRASPPLVPAAESWELEQVAARGRPPAEAILACVVSARRADIADDRPARRRRGAVASATATLVASSAPGDAALSAAAASSAAW
jgi:hypothetical protein